MSIIAPASSRWSRPASGGPVAPLAQRGVLVGGGRVGRVRQRRVERRRARPRACATSGSSSLTRALTACISAIASDASAPVRLASPIAFAPALRLACASSSSGRSALSRSRSASAASSRSSDPSRRRASAARTGSGSRAIALRSSMRLPRGRAVGRLRRARRDVVTSEPDSWPRNRASAWASAPTTMFCGIGPDENPPLRIAYSAQFSVTLRWSKFGPSLYSRVRTLVAEPWVPATLRV